MTTSDFYGIIILRVPSVVYGYSSVSIWGGAVRRCNRKWRDRKWCDLKLRDRKSRQSGALAGSMFCACATGSGAISVLIGPFDRKWRKSRDRKKPCPEVALTGNRFCACPSFSRAFFFVVVPWLPWLSGFPWVCRSSSKQCWLGVFSKTSASYYHRKPPRPIFSYWN